MQRETKRRNETRPGERGSAAKARRRATAKRRNNTETDDQSKSPLAGSDYHNLPALEAYIARVGAEKRNFRRFVVKLEAREHYHYDAAVIQISKDNKTIKCNNKEYEPTEEEQEAIEAELARATFPKSEAVRDISDLRELIRKTKKRDPNK